MKDSALRLQSKTVLLAGPFNGITQAILRSMTEFGADIAYFCHETPQASRYVDGLNEAREVHPEYGRAASFALPLGTPEQVSEALGRMTESFGRMDILIDATPLAWNEKSDFQASLNVARGLAEQCLPFLLAKQRGRILYLFEDECLKVLQLPQAPAEARARLGEQIKALAYSLRGKNITANGLSLGVTEDYILRHFAKMGSIRKSLEELQKKHVGLKLVESTEVGLGAAYLASGLSVSLTGQMLRLTHGFHLEPQGD